MTTPSHPYSALPQGAHWRRSVSEVRPGDVDPVGPPPFTVSPADKVATAGSCFAQHIARRLEQNGFNYFVAEPAHPLVPGDLATAYNYAVFSARYGNIYTSRQLLQLFRRAYGAFSPADVVWAEDDGSFLDPFRPRINPRGFSSVRDLEEDGKQHLASVRRMFDQLDVFVFTLGLTEGWVAVEDGAAYPLCPGTAGGRFDAARHRFQNFSVTEVFSDLVEFIDALRGVNPTAKVILTVSPVPLVATAEQGHVLTATTYSKSVLRVAADMVAKARENVAYFPAYEIITGAFNRGSYFAEDLRSVTEAGVSHVMRLFLRHYAGRESEPSAEIRIPAAPEPETAADGLQEVIATVCDEEILGASL